MTRTLDPTAYVALVKAWLTDAIARDGYTRTAATVGVTENWLRQVHAGHREPGPKFAHVIGVTVVRTQPVRTTLRYEMPTPTPEAPMQTLDIDTVTDLALTALPRPRDGATHSECPGCTKLVHHSDRSEHARTCSDLRAIITEGSPDAE